MSTGIRINEIPLDATLAGTDLVHVYKNFSGNFQSVAAPLSAVAFQGQTGVQGPSGVRGDKGDDGRSTAQLVAYLRLPPGVNAQQYKPGASNGAGAVNDDGSYNFGTRVYATPQNTGPNNDKDWSAGPPVFSSTGVDSGGIPLSTYNLWSSFGVAQITGLTGTDDSIIWSDPETSGIDGLPGSPGRSTYQAVVYTRSDSKPQRPHGGSFDFGTDTLVPPTATDVTWYVDIGGDLGPPEVDAEGEPTGGLWVCNNQFSIPGDEGKDHAGLWKGPSPFGLDGADGKSTYYGLIYKRTTASNFAGSSVGTSTGLSADNGYYDFRANAFVLPNDIGESMEGWYEEPPEELQDGVKTPLYMSSTVATVTGNFLDNKPMIDAVLAWSDAKLVQTPAVDGNQGRAIAQLKVYIRSVGLTPPATPTGGEFDFGSGILDVSDMNGWSSLPIASSLDGTDPNRGSDNLWVSLATAAADHNGSEYPNDADLTWSTPIISGEDGLDSVATYLGQCFTRYSGDVDMQTETFRPTGGYYNFSTNTLQPPSAPGINTLGVTWSNTIPPGVGQIYITQQQFATIGNTGIKSGGGTPSQWSTPAVMAYDGAAGFSGVTNKTITLYYPTSSIQTGSDIPNFPNDVSVKVDLLSSSSVFGKVTKSFLSGGRSGDIDVTSNKVMSGSVFTGWYTSVPNVSASDGTALDVIYGSEATAADSDMGDGNHIDSISGSEFADTVLLYKPGSNGLVGIGTSQVNLFQRTNSINPPSPNKPTGDVNFYISTSGANAKGSFSVPTSSTLNGWLSVQPSFSALDPGGAKHYLWGITATAAARESFDTITDTEWSSPFIVSQNPFDLTQTTVSHIVQAFKNSSDAPSDNPGLCTVAMTGENAGIITTETLDNGWSKSIPSTVEGQDLYIVQATASQSVTPTTTTDDVSASEWSAPARYSGPRGQRGLDGSIAKSISLYKRTDYTPAPGETDLPTASGSYDFLTNTWTFGDFVSAGPGVSPAVGTSNGWSFNIPAKDTTDRLLHQTFATAISTQSNVGVDIVGATEWATPAILTQDGTGIKFLGEFTNRHTLTSVGNYPISGLEGGEAYYDQALNKSFTFIKSTSAFQLLARDGKEIATIERTNGNTEVTITYDDNTTDTFSLSDGGLLEIGDVVRDSSTGTVTMELSVNGVRNAKTFNIADGDGIASVSAYDIPNATNPTATRVVLITDNGDTRPPFDVVRGLPGITAGVAAVYADDVNGTNASFTVGTREFVKYHEFTGTAPAILEYQYNPDDTTQNGLLTGGFTKFVGNSGTSITPIYANQATNPTAVSLTQGSNNFINFFEGSVDTVNTNVVTKSDGTTVAIDSLTFVQIKGSDGTSVTIKGTKDNASELTALVGSAVAGDSYLGSGNGDLNEGHLHVFDPSSNTFKDVGSIQGPQGNSIKGNPGDAVTAIYATDAAGTGATLTPTSDTVFVLFFSGNPNNPNTGSKLSSADDVTAALATLSDPLFVKYRGAGISGLSTVRTVGETNTTGRQVTYKLSYDDGTSDEFTVTDGVSGSPIAVTDVLRDSDSNLVTLKFDTTGDGVADTTKTFTLNDGDGIASITPEPVTSGSFLSATKITVTRDSGATTNFLINNGSAINVAVVYAKDTTGTDASYTIADNSYTFVKYHEYFGLSGAPDIATFSGDGVNAGGFTKFEGVSGTSITPIYADAGGNNPSLTQGSKTHVNFFEDKVTSIVGTTITRGDGTTLDSSTLTFVNLKGDQGLTGESGRPNGYEAIPFYSNNDPTTITYIASAEELVLSEHSNSSDIGMGMVYPAINCDGFRSSGKTISGIARFKISSSIGDALPGLSVYFRAYEYNEELPPGKIAVGHPDDGGSASLADSRVQSGNKQVFRTFTGWNDTDRPNNGYFKENGKGSTSSFLEAYKPEADIGYTIGDGTGSGILTATEFVSVPFEYTPGPNAKYVSFGFLNWDNANVLGKIDVDDEDGDGRTNDQIGYNRNYVADINATITPSILVNSGLNNPGSYVSVRSTVGSSSIYDTRVALGNNFFKGDFIRAIRDGVDIFGNPKKFVDYYGYTGTDNDGSTSLAAGDWERRETTDKNLHVKSLTFNINGAKGDEGTAGTTPVTINVYKKEPLSFAQPSTSPGSGQYNKSTGVFAFDASQDNGWGTVLPAAESTKRIFVATVSTGHAANDTSGSLTINANQWSNITTFSLTPGRNAPTVTHTVVYDVLNSFGNLQAHSTTRGGSISFRKKESAGIYIAAATTGSIPIYSGWSSGITTSTDPISAIGQIVWNKYDAAGNDQSEFWEEMKRGLQLLWKYDDKWILFQRTSLVDNSQDYRVMNVEVVEKSENLSTISDLPGIYLNNDSAYTGHPESERTPFTLGYEKVFNNETIHLYYRSNSLSTPQGPTAVVEYNFSTGSITSTDSTWATAINAAGTGKYLWRITATASGVLDDSTGVYTDSIATSEWSSAAIIAQDGDTGPSGKTFFQKFLYTRVATEEYATFNLIGNKWNTNSKPGTLDIVTRTDGISDANDADRLTKVRNNDLSQLVRTNITWYEDIPPESLGNHLYVTVATVTDTANAFYTEVPNSAWTEPVKLAKDGVGINTAVVRLYKRTTGDSPSTGDEYVSSNNRLGLGAGASITNVFYNFNSGNLNTGAVNMNGWSTSLPTDGGGTLWVSRATASSSLDNDTIKASEWSEPEILVVNGSGLTFVGQFLTREKYKKHINDKFGGIPPENSYHIEPETDSNGNLVYYTRGGTQVQRNVSILYKGPQTAGGINNDANFVQLTIDGQPGLDGTITKFIGTYSTVPGASNGPTIDGKTGAAFTPQNGNIYKNSANNTVYIWESTAGDSGEWEVLTSDGADGNDSTVAGPDGKQVFICYNGADPNPDSPPTKPVNSNNGTGAGWTTTASSAMNWMSQKIARQANDASIAWSAPILITGQQGEAGYRTVTLKIFKRSFSRPTTPPSSGNSRGAYFFGNTAGGTWKFAPPVGWSSNVANTSVDPVGQTPTYAQGPYERDGYEWNLGTNAVNARQVGNWTVVGTENQQAAISDGETLGLWSCEAVASVLANDSVQIDDDIYWSTPVQEVLNGADITNQDVDRIFGAVKNGGGVEKIVATDRLGNLLTQAAYDSLADTSEPDSRTTLYGWRNSDALGGADRVDAQTLYLIF